MILQHLRPARPGVAIGLAGAIAMGRWLQSFVYGVARSPSQ
jgi:F0F1-type ATP synthase membrane subunit c/vacuolar-type H+-ATPase subunit K